MSGKFKCSRCGKTFDSERALTIHAEVRREDGVLATYTPAEQTDEVKSDETN